MKEKTFEEELTTLEEIVKELENGDVDLEKSIDKYTQAMQIAKTCGAKLDNATKKVNKILNENNELEDFQISE